MPRHSDQTLSAIKQAVDIVALVGEYLPLHRAGSKYKSLCPFHDDHRPSMEINPDRQSYKCWSCGAGGDIFDFVKEYERVDFPEALRMLADRAGVELSDGARSSDAPRGTSKAELLEVAAWAEATFVAALTDDSEAFRYAVDRGLTVDSIRRFRLGAAPDARDWLSLQARRAGISATSLEQVGLIVRSENQPVPHERFRGRLIFPIHDLRGRTIGFGGRILPSVEKTLAESGRRAAKYLNSPETILFQKRKSLYGANQARQAARDENWVAVMEGYTDVIAAHQVGFTNVVGTLGTALGDDHVGYLRRLADRSVLVFDGDEAGQKAADRSLELFLNHEVDVRVLTLPEEFDPCDFLLSRGAEPFRLMLDRSVDPLDFVINRAADRFDLGSLEGSRQGAEYVLAVLAQAPQAKGGTGLDLKVAKALDLLSRKLSLPVSDLKKRLGELRRPKSARPEHKPPAAELAPVARPPIVLSDLDPLDRELVKIALDDPTLVPSMITRIGAATLADPPLRAILSACYELQGEGTLPTGERVISRLDDPSLRALVAGMQRPVSDPNFLMLETGLPAPPADRLVRALARFDERERKARLKDVKAALDETSPESDPLGHRALQRELYQLLTQGRTRTSHAS